MDYKCQVHCEGKLFRLSTTPGNYHFFHHTNIKQSASSLEKKNKLAEKSLRDEVASMIWFQTRPKNNCAKVFSGQRFIEWSGSRAVQLQEDLRKQLLDICSPLTTQLHCCLSVAFCCDSNTLCPFAWKQNQSFQYPQIIRIFPELCTNFYKSTWSTDSIAKIN